MDADDPRNLEIEEHVMNVSRDSDNDLANADDEKIVSPIDEKNALDSDHCHVSPQEASLEEEENETPKKSPQQLESNVQEEREAEQDVTLHQGESEGNEQVEAVQKETECHVEKDARGYSSTQEDLSDEPEKVSASCVNDVPEEVSRELSDAQDTRNFETQGSEGSEEKGEVVVKKNEALQASTVDHPTLSSKHEEDCSVKESDSTNDHPTLFSKDEEEDCPVKESSIIEKNEIYQEEKENIKGSNSGRKSRGIQTTVQLLDSSIFREFSLDVATMQVEIGLMTVDSLQELDPEIDDWPLLLVSQLRLRDSVINTLNTMLTDVLDKGRRLEEDVDYLKLKILDLKQQVKRNKKNRKVFSSQTTDEDFAAAWSKWYSRPYQYYNQDEANGMYSSAWEYVQQPTISPATQVPVQTANESALPAAEEAAPKPQVDGKSDVCSKCCVDDDICNLGDKGDQGDDNSKKMQCECTRKTKDEERDTAKHRKRRKPKTQDKIVDGKTKSENQDEPSVIPTASAEEPCATEISSQVTPEGEEESCKPDEPGLSGREESAHGWDNSGEMSILDQVKAAANEAVQGSGYVFQEELGLYYDYSTQYYYNAETGLYYDPRTGTYFYYDHASQAYQFHSQVPVDEKAAKRGKRKDDAEREDSEGKRVKRIRKAKERNEEEREEGECTDSGEEDELEQEEEAEEEMRNEEAAEDCVDREETIHVPPSLRLMVIESTSERVKVGTLHLVTLDGGTVGREAKNLVQLPDLNISKVHAEISYRSEGPDDHHYYLKDLGSNNGTFVNDARLSEPRETSQEVELGHGWTLQFGPVKVKCHIHPGLLTCNECEPGLVNANQSSHDTGNSVVSYKNAKTREKARKKELQAMKKKYAITSSGAPAASADYNDRADRRRKEVGSDNPYEKTEVASTEVALRGNNKGFALLQKMGWSEGQSLGKSQKGIKQPIQPESVVGRAGFGSTVADTTPSVTEKKRKKVLQITKQRYNQTLKPT
ncbi:glutamic acid-rich protein-like isoform X1 [Penaeus japonicus]|uniref:glutamic acid-rich protein-like isoform X1 n=1 Tax=Penaeus japonicus TaxID=27405 RepID=UPI001C7167A5|nr:glutamic acid-rich protein-like isoform X1 [Penaeus japonicus]